jgi:HK97 gp10 family phage protein
MPWYVEMKGADEMNKRILELTKSVRPDVVEPVLLKGAKTIADDARSRAPLGPTGNLKRGIISKTLQRRGDAPAPAMAGINYGVAPHAHLVEFGHGGKVAAPHPFFRPAWDSNKGRVEEEIKDKLINAIMESV